MQGELEAGLQQTSFQQCVQSEQATREQIRKEWSTFTTSDKTHCVALAKTGGESSYTELITWMEMARDVRFGSKADIRAPSSDVRFTPESGHRLSLSGCPLCARSGLLHRSNRRQLLVQNQESNCGPGPSVRDFVP